MQADFTVVYIRHKIFEVLKVIDISTWHGERSIPTSRSLENNQKLIETICTNQHGAPIAFSAQPEFCKKSLRAFLNRHNIKVRPRPFRSLHKNEKFEQNCGLFKYV